MFDVYYNSPKPINNVIYKAIFDRVLSKYETVKYRYEALDRREDGKVYLKNYLRKLGESVKRIKNQITFDETHYQHKFLGVLTSDFQTILAEVCVVLIPILPTLLSNMLGSS
jgi:hypothetical protein